MCVRGDGCVGLQISLVVCLCVFVSWKDGPGKGAYMLYIWYLEHTLGGTNEAAH